MLKNKVLLPLSLLFVSCLCCCSNNNKENESQKETANSTNEIIDLTIDNYLYYLSETTHTSSDSFSTVKYTYFSGSPYYMYHDCILYYCSLSADTTAPDFHYSEIKLSISGVGEYTSYIYIHTSGMDIVKQFGIKKVSGTVERA